MIGGKIRVFILNSHRISWKSGEDMLHGGCWIFLSHASKDIDSVRRVRNEFEKYGQNPLAFHLRCLDEEYPQKRSNGLLTLAGGIVIAFAKEILTPITG